MKAYLTEFIGTFFLMLRIGLVVLAPGGIVGSEPGAVAARAIVGAVAPLAIGCVLMAVVFMGGHVSGAHYNPAVSLAVLLRGKMAAKDFIPYVVVQIAAAGLAGVLVRHVLLHMDLTSAKPYVGDRMVAALLAEFLFTFILALVILNVATAKGTSGNSFYGLAIGFVVTGGAYAVGTISGAAFNPAVGVGVVALGAPVANLWLHIVAPLAGGAAAAGAFKVMNPDG